MVSDVRTVTCLEDRSDECVLPEFRVSGLTMAATVDLKNCGGSLSPIPQSKDAR